MSFPGKRSGHCGRPAAPGGVGRSGFIADYAMLVMVAVSTWRPRFPGVCNRRGRHPCVMRVGVADSAAVLFILCDSFPCLPRAPSDMTDRLRRTKSLATLGPATDPPGVLEALFRAGVNVVRL